MCITHGRFTVIHHGGMVESMCPCDMTRAKIHYPATIKTTFYCHGVEEVVCILKDESDMVLFVYGKENKKSEDVEVVEH